ncbi:MAG: protoporphyrinogen oxidase [Actinomycetota bacterium]|nr:protoporphyrinogen oxidase [Actinomycetota bacterium]
MTHVAILGGGLAGLATAFELQRSDHTFDLYEASDRFGGKVWSSLVGDRMVDAGADTFLARVPQGRALCEQLGLADQLTSPVAPVPAYIHRSGALHELPKGTVLGVPTDLDELAASGLISAQGLAEVAAEPTRPPTDLGGDISVGAYFRERLGDEVTERLIDPMIGGINASDIDRLSLRSAAPQIAAAAQGHVSILEGLRAARASVGATLGSAGPGADEPVFYGLPGGTARIIDALVAVLDARSLHLGASPTLDGLGADRVVIATPAPAASRLLAEVSPTASRLLAEIQYSSVAQVSVEFEAQAVTPHLDASGILFPRVDGMVLTACTWFSTKWAHYQRADRVLLRLTSGRFGDTRALDLGDEALVNRLLTEVQCVLDITAEPTALRVHRWIDALPQYVPGHADRVEAIFAALGADAPHITLAGAAYRGIGIPATIASAWTAAQAVRT